MRLFLFSSKLEVRGTRGVPVRVRSEAQAALTGAVRQGRDATVVLVAGPVEDHAVDPGRLGPLDHQLADLLGLGGLVAVEAAQVRLHGGRRRDGLAHQVVDDLDGDVLRRARHDEARTLRRTRDLLATTDLTTQARPDARRGVLVVRKRDRHGHLPAFPTLRRMCSPAYRTPLPLYGSGLRSLRMFAATSPTSCLSIPWTPSRVGPSTVKVMPSGALKVIEWEYPSWNSSWVGPFDRTR